VNPRTAGLADPRETAVGEAEDLGFVDAEISRSDEVAGRVEDDAVRMGRVLASLARAAAGIFDLPAHGAEPSMASIGGRQPMPPSFFGSSGKHNGAASLYQTDEHRGVGGRRIGS
jgi:hypothetical protein